MTPKNQANKINFTLRSSILAALAMLLVVNAQGQTPLATEPFTSEDKLNALPNVMFVLDDSSSMKWDFLPDWADPDPNGTANPGTGYPDSQPEFRFRNSSYNGLAYDPAIRYRPPAMFDSSGNRDYTTYPSMTGESVSAGGDATASPTSRNWRKVQVDGYKVQANTTENLEGAAYYYYTIAGEYCTEERLRTCTESSAPTGSYKKAAPLRWCKTAAKASASTATAATDCQAINIADNTGGVATYTFARTPYPSIARITFAAAGTVTNITVDGARIMAQDATGGSSSDLAAAVAAQINACKTGKPAGALCTAFGYRATSLNDQLTVYAPHKTTLTPVVTGVAQTFTAFASSVSVPGEVRMVPIHPDQSSYTLPGSVEKGANRSDCVGTTCTYAEEMTNYANWYAYYRTRMQAMKSAASLAFSGVTDKFRVGYYSVNNGTGLDFINVDTFSGSHKYDWYSRFLLARPFGATPTRGALAAMGRMFANKQPYVHLYTAFGFAGLPVNDPMQYSCQQNYTILSTDGYWTNEQNKQYSLGETDPNNFTLTDVLPQTLAGDYSVGPNTPGKVIGQQDGSEDRPYYDGAQFTRTETRVSEKLEQIGTNVFTLNQRTLHQQTKEQPLTQVITTTTTWPKTLKTWQLETQTTPLNKTEYALEQKTYPLGAQTQNLEEKVYRIRSETRPLERRTYNLINTPYTLEQRERTIDKYVSPLEKNEQKINKLTYQLQKAEVKMASATTKLRQHIQPVKSTTWDLQETVTEIKQTTYKLEKKIYKLTAYDFQLQKRSETSSNGGETWVSTGWVNVTSGSCEVRASGPGYVRNTECQYVSTTTPGLSSCSETTPKSVGPIFTVSTARSCNYEGTPASTTEVTSCTRDAPESVSPFAEYVTCSYNASGTVANNQTSCSANDQAGANPATWTNDKVTCEYEAAAKTPSSVGSCTATTTNTAAAVKRTCAYKTSANTATYPASCSNNDQSSNAAGTLWSGNKTVCAYDDTKNARTFVAECTPNDPGTAYNADKVVCSYSNSLTSASDGAYGAYDLASCSKKDQSALTTKWTGDRVFCQYEYAANATLPAARWSDASGDSCTRRAQDTSGYTVSQIRCRYNPTADSPIASGDTGLSSCTVYSESSGSATYTFTGDKKDCVYDGNSTWSPESTCTKRTPSDFSNTQVLCRYGTEKSPTAVSACTRKDYNVGNGTDLTGTTSGDKVRCEWRSYGSWGAAPGSPQSCTWNNPADVSSTGRECRYVAGTPSAPAASCTSTPRQTVTTSGTTWTAPKNECAYDAAVVNTNLTTCSETGTNNGTNQYTTCGYGAITHAPDLTACTVDPTETGPNYSNGSTRACFYQTAAYSTNVKTTCNQVAQDTTNFSAPQVTCTYATAVPSSNLTSCTDKLVSTANPFEGPAVTCAYATTPTSTQEVTSCAAHRNTASPFTGGAAVDCSYKAAGTTTNNVASCVEQAQTPAPGPNYVGPQRVCTYGTASGWTDVTSGQCDVVTQAGPTFSGPARECRYRALTDTYADNTCTDLNQLTVTPYTVRLARQCVNSPFSTPSTTATTTVDSCATTPTSVTDPVTGINVATATTCTYQAGSFVDTPSCVARVQDTVSPFVKAVQCGVSDVTVAVEPTCSEAGALPDVFDASGKIVVCSRTDTEGTEGAPKPVAGCTASINGGTKQQTTCTPLINSLKAVASCTPDDPPSGPNYIKRTCPTTVTTSNTMGCREESAVEGNGYRTVTCAPIADTGTKNTLADVAIYYYNTDLRTPALGNCTGAIVSPAIAGNDLCSTAVPDPLNNVPVTTTDNRAYQHMTTFTLGLGASGYMKYSETYAQDSSGDFITVKGNSPYGPGNGITADPNNGVCSWQADGQCNWPFPDAGEQTTIDDLWHAGVNGRGGYFNAADPKKLGEAISSALSKVEAASGAAAAPTISSPRLAPADNYIFSSTYTSADWSGEIRRYQIDPFSGVVSPEIDWAVQAKLDAKASRTIYTFDATVATTQLKAFTAANFGTDARFNTPHISTAPSGLSQFLCASTEPCLPAASQTSSTAAGANLVRYLAGDRTHEGKADNNTKYYRERASVLGDMVNAQVVYVTKPLYSYGDPGYSTYKENQQSRQAVVYAGANDGMLHAFAAKGSAATEALVEAAAAKYAEWYRDQSDTTLRDAKDAAKTLANAALGADTTVAQELWAYIPTKVMPHLYKLADKLYRNPGKHRYYVDATPVVGDICTSSCNSGSAVWKTILVGGLGRGGRGYYALDITDPANPKALWEFSDNNLGYSYGNPQITKMSDGKWVVLVASGYNNIPNEDGSGGDGVGRFVLDAVTGVQVSGVSPISTGAGSVAAPSGLSKITAQVKNPLYDNTIVAVYGGDLLGNLWRFDVNGNVGTAGVEAQLLATLKDGSAATGGKAQPITTKPEIGLIDDKVVVFIGTGRLLAGADIGDASLQSLYAIKDAGTGTATPNVTPIFDNPGGVRNATSPENLNATTGFVRQLQKEITCPTGHLTCSSGETIVTSTNYPVSFATNNGWYVDLVHAAERMLTDPTLGLGLLAFNTNVPSLAACDIDGKSYSYALDYRDGGPPYYPGNGSNASDNGVAGKLLTNSFASSPQLIVTQSGGVFKVSGTPSGIMTEPESPPPGITPARRTSWRELIETN